MRVRPLVMPDDRQPVRDFLAASRSRGELSENKTARLQLDAGRKAVGIVGEEDGEILVFAALAPAASSEEWAMEVVSDQDSADLGSVVDRASDLARGLGASRLRWWVYEGMRVADPTSLGFDPERRLLLMARSLPAPEEPVLPATVRVEPFRPGVDEAAWLAANNAAFAGHPENGSLTLEDLESRMAMDWFDPGGLRMAWEEDELAGFCWTKIHPSGEGEIYIIGTVPRFQRRGLGRALVLEGMRYLNGRGCDEVILYTEGDNVPAVRLYESLGMRIQAVNRSFIRALVGV